MDVRIIDKLFLLRAAGHPIFVSEDGKEVILPEEVDDYFEPHEIPMLKEYILSQHREYDPEEIARAYAADEAVQAYIRAKQREK